jgi:hypothetical protein
MTTSIKKIVTTPLILLAILGVSVTLASATPTPTYAEGEAVKCGSGKDAVRTSFDFGCPSNTSGKSKNLQQNPIYVVLLYIINTLSVGVGVVIVGSIVWQSIQYASANGSNEKVKSAKNGITNAIIALLLFISMYSLLNFIIPGGIFN